MAGVSFYQEMWGEGMGLSSVDLMVGLAVFGTLGLLVGIAKLRNKLSGY